MNVVYEKEDVAHMQGSLQQVEQDSRVDTARNVAPAPGIRPEDRSSDDDDDDDADKPRKPGDSPPAVTKPLVPKKNKKKKNKKKPLVPKHPPKETVPPPEPAPPKRRASPPKPAPPKRRASGRTPQKRNGSQKVLAVVDGNLEGSSALLDALNSLKTRVTEDGVAMGSRGFVKLHLSTLTMWRATDELKRKARTTEASTKRKKERKEKAGTISFRINWKYLQLMQDTGFKSRVEYVFTFDLIFRHKKTKQVGAMKFKNMRFSHFNDARKCSVLESEVGAFLYKCREAVKRSHQRHASRDRSLTHRYYGTQTTFKGHGGDRVFKKGVEVQDPSKRMPGSRPTSEEESEGDDEDDDGNDDDSGDGRKGRRLNKRTSQHESESESDSEADFDNRSRKKRKGDAGIETVKLVKELTFQTCKSEELGRANKKLEDKVVDLEQKKKNLKDERAKLLKKNKQIVDEYTRMKGASASCAMTSLLCRTAMLSCRTVLLSCRTTLLSCNTTLLSCRTAKLSCMTGVLSCRTTSLSCKALYLSSRTTFQDNILVMEDNNLVLDDNIAAVLHLCPAPQPCHRTRS